MPSVTRQTGTDAGGSGAGAGASLAVGGVAGGGSAEAGGGGGGGGGAGGGAEPPQATSASRGIAVRALREIMGGIRISTARDLQPSPCGRARLAPSETLTSASVPRSASVRSRARAPGARRRRSVRRAAGCASRPPIAQDRSERARRRDL